MIRVNLGFDKLVFTNAVGNSRSRRIKEKTGARLVEVVPGTFVNPDFTRQEVWELTKDEWTGLDLAANSTRHETP